jgi:uncharacterized protein
MEPALRQPRRPPWSLPLAFVLLLLLAARPGNAADADLATVVTQSGARFVFHVEVADTPSARARGLMFRPRLAEDAGMLFLFEVPEIQSFWMKNTEIPLDMLFLGPDGRVIDLHRNAVPYSTENIVSKVSAQAVLEIPGGTSARLGIRVGDRVEHAALRRR